jgi:hypothetical protein
MNLYYKLKGKIRWMIRYFRSWEQHKILKKYRKYIVKSDPNGKSFWGIEKWGMECGNGWNKIIKSIFQKIDSMHTDVIVVQIKEKFGGLRFYIHNGNDEIRKYIAECEKESYNVCEVCGKRGEYRGKLPWKQTLCMKHYIDELKRLSKI